MTRDNVRMRDKVKAKFKRLQNVMMVNSGLCGAMLAGTLNTAFAAGATDGVAMGIKIIGILCFVPGVYFLAIGFSERASAKADEDGPAMKKANGKLIASASLFIVGYILKEKADTFTSYLVTDI